MDIDEALYRLQLYNEKVEKLRRSGFFRRIMADHGIKVTVSAAINQPLVIDRNGPGEDNIDAFITTYRFFIQPRDKIDRPHMREVYEALRDEFGFATGEYEQAIKQAIKAVDSAGTYFAGATPFKIDGEVVSRATLHDVIIYGGLAHANRDKKAVYDRWAAMPTYSLIEHQFMTILIDALRSIMSLQELHKRAIEFLEQKKASDVRRQGTGA